MVVVWVRILSRIRLSSWLFFINWWIWSINWGVVGVIEVHSQIWSCVSVWFLHLGHLLLLYIVGNLVRRFSFVGRVFVRILILKLWMIDWFLFIIGGRFLKKDKVSDKFKKLYENVFKDLVELIMFVVLYVWLIFLIRCLMGGIGLRFESVGEYGVEKWFLNCKGIDC